MSAIWRSVILSPLGTPLTYWSIVSSSERSPLPAAWSSRVAVKVLVTLPIRWCTSGGIGSPEARSATPRVRTHVYRGVCTAATTPGASLPLKDFFNAASRSAVDACSPPPLVWVPAAESPLLPSSPPHPLPSRSTNPVTRSTPFHIDRCIFWTNKRDPSQSAIEPYTRTPRKPRLPPALTFPNATSRKTSSPPPAYTFPISP